MSTRGLKQKNNTNISWCPGVLYQKAKQMDEARGPFNIQKFYSSNNPAVWKTSVNTLDMLQQVSNVTKPRRSVPRKRWPRFLK